MRGWVRLIPESMGRAVGSEEAGSSVGVGCRGASTPELRGEDTAVGGGAGKPGGGGARGGTKGAGASSGRTVGITLAGAQWLSERGGGPGLGVAGGEHGA